MLVFRDVFFKSGIGGVSVAGSRVELLKREAKVFFVRVWLTEEFGKCCVEFEVMFPDYFAGFVELE